MRKYTLKYLLILLAVYSCSDSDSPRRIIVDGSIAEGDISKDSVYNGMINFYDSSTGKLTQSVNYVNGIASGVRRDYYPNGKVRLESNYDNDKVNGEILFFDSTGNLVESQNRYYDLRVGPSIQYKAKNVSQYYFYSFDNDELFDINYDSIDGKRIDELNGNSFFFWHVSPFHTSESDKELTDIFLYLPNPPKLNFLYSICIIMISSTKKRL